MHTHSQGQPGLKCHILGFNRAYKCRRPNAQGPHLRDLVSKQTLVGPIQQNCISQYFVVAIKKAKGKLLAAKDMFSLVHSPRKKKLTVLEEQSSVNSLGHNPHPSFLCVVLFWHSNQYIMFSARASSVGSPSKRKGWIESSLRSDRLRLHKHRGSVCAAASVACFTLKSGAAAATITRLRVSAAESHLTHIYHRMLQLRASCRTNQETILKFCRT